MMFATWLICEEQSIRDVMLKNNRALDLMTNSPADVDPRQLRELKLEIAGKSRVTASKPEIISKRS